MPDKRQMIEALDGVDSFAGVRNMVRVLAEEQGHWAGCPIPVEGAGLVIHPSYPFAEALSGEKDVAPEGVKVRNGFYSTRWRCIVIVYEEDGKIKHVISPAVHSLDQQLGTMGASVVWGVEQEHNALNLLGTLVRHHTFKMYLLTGSFVEKSEKSGITYMFRKLRPTVALCEKRGRMRVLCSLCMHPIAYYSGSWAGAMCPTDDVIAHLMLMRGDEHMFWKRCNQHPANRPEAGL